MSQKSVRSKNTAQTRKAAIAWFKQAIPGRLPGKSAAERMIRDAEDPMAAAKGWVEELDSRADLATEQVVKDAWKKIKEKFGIVPQLEGRLLQRLTDRIREEEYSETRARRIADAILNREHFHWF